MSVSIELISHRITDAELDCLQNLNGKLSIPWFSENNEYDVTLAELVDEF